jgi:hypothetical protein
VAVSSRLRRVTTKLITALYGDHSRPALHEAELRESLAASGCTAVQVNVDDADVAPAMRFGPGDPAGRPITAFVTVWTENANLTLGVLTGLEAGSHVYRVTEHRRLDPPAVPDGERADALTNIAVLRRPDGMNQAEYLDYWLVRHTPIAIRTQATFGYIQNVVEEALTQGAPAIAAIVEELFPMAAMTDTHAFYGSGGDNQELRRRITELMTSVARFGAGTGLDLVPTSRYRWILRPTT